MPRTARLLAAAVVIALPLLLASCSRTYSNGHEFRNGSSFAALKADGTLKRLSTQYLSDYTSVPLFK